MRSSTIIAAAFAAMAAAKPIMIKRDYVTEIAVVTVIQTVYADGPAPTAEPEITFTEEQKQLAPVTTVEAAPAPTVEAAPIEEEVVEATSEKAPEPVVTQEPEPEPVVTQEPEPVTSEAAPAPSSAQPEAPATPSAPGQDASFIDIILYNHNIHRANHSAPDLTYDADLAASAQALVKDCKMAHNVELGPASGYGQNLAAAGPTIDVAKSVSGGWYTGEAPLYDNLYGLSDPGSVSDFHAWGHFSALVWKGTQKVGCAVNTACKTQGLGMELLACNYWPAGNSGDYDQNVLRPLGASTYSG